MKKIILSITVVASAIVFGQKKEINAAFKAIEAGDNATAISKLNEAENILSGKTYLLEPSLLEHYYYAKGISLIKGGKIAEGAEFLSKINDIKKVYTGKNSNKERVYYVGKEAADASGVEGLKETTYQPSLSAQVGNAVNPYLQSANKEAMDAYNSKKYAVAAPKFKQVYDLLKAAGQDNKQYLYYSAITYALDNNKSKAIDVYKDLINSGYTGVETTYKAKNKKTGQVENLDKTSWELMKKTGEAGDYTDFKIETSKSVEQELYETLVALLIETERYDEAIPFIDKGKKKFPKSNKLSELLSIAYYKAGKTDQAIENMKVQVAQNPNDKDTWYNLGVLASQDTNRREEAEGYFKKALEIDPNYIPALQGIFYNIYMGNDAEAVKEIIALQKTDIDLANKKRAERRDRFAKGLPYLEKWYALEPKNIDVVSTLKGVYQTLHKDDMFKKMKEIEESLSK